MKRYFIDLNACPVVIRDMVRNAVHGAQLALMATGYRLAIGPYQAGEQYLFFRTDCDAFVSRWGIELSNYGLVIKQEGGVL